MGKLGDLLSFRGRRGQEADELSDAALVVMLRAAAAELTALRSRVQRIAVLAHEPERPDDAVRRLRAIATLLREHGS